MKIDESVIDKVLDNKAAPGEAPQRKGPSPLQDSA